MCNIWKVPSSVPNLPIRDWVALLSSDLNVDIRELDITGGEPFLRDDLVSLIEAVADLKRNHLRELRSIAITTNGVLNTRVVRMVDEMLSPVERNGLGLVIVCALDAVGELHDEIRRYKGAWEAVNKCISGLIELRSEHPGLVVGLKTTVLARNIGQLDRIAAYADERGLFTIISPAIITSGRYLNLDKKNDLTLSEDDRFRLAEFYAGSRFKWSYHARALATYLRTGRIKKPCSCGFNYFFVRSTGEVFLCPLFEESVGNCTNTPIDEVFRSVEARRIRHRVGRSPECMYCTEPGLERYSLPYEGFSYLATLLRQGTDAFLELHYHLGLDKYI